MEPTEKKLERTSSLSSTILDYYYKFGQNRDLEKYLRRRRTCRSSSEGSLNILADEKTHKPKKGTVENQAEGSRVKDSESAPPETVSTKPVSKEVKVKTTGLLDGKKKSYSFNCESNIAISLPYLGPPLPAETTVADTMTESSQTDFDEVTKESSIQSVKEDTTKSHKRLEWDSLGDVGYNKTASVREQSDLAVSSLERNVLKSFFSNRGIDINFSEGGKKVVLPDIPETLTPQKTQPRPKERWRETLESVKKKYDKQLLDNSSNKVEALRFNELSLNRHSTPKLDRPEKGLQTSIVHTESKEVQVDLTNECSSAAAIDETARSSFEFIPAQLPGKENVSPNTNSSSEISRNVRSQLQSKNLESSSTAMTTSSESTNNELELGIKLLCSLIESKNLTGTKKKTLARKIVSRIVNRNISRNGSTSRAGSSNRLLTSSSGRSTSGRAINISGLKPLSRGSSTPEKSKTEKQTRARTTSTQSENTVERVMSSSNEYAKSSTTTLSSPKTAVRRDSEPKTDSTESTKGRDSKSEVQPPTDQNQTMRTWLDPITQSEFNYNRKKSREAEIALIKKKPNSDFVPTKARRTTVPDRELVPQVVLIDQKAGGDFVPTGPRRPSQILDFITNERKSHLNWIENEIHHLENLKDLLLSSKEKSFTAFQPAPRTELVFSAYTHRTTPNNVYDKVASSSEVSSSVKSLPANYRETEVVSEKEIVNIGKGYRRTEKRHEDEVFYDTVTTKERPGTEPIRHSLKTTSLEIQEEKRFPKKNYVSDDEFAGAKHRSKLETPKTGADESVTTFARQRKEEFLKNYNKPQQPTTDYDDPAETDHYSEPCEPTKLKPKPPKTDAYNSATSSDFFVSSESISLPGGSTSTTTTTHQYDSRTGIGIQTTESLMQTRPIYGPQLGCGCKNPQGCFCPRPTIRTYRTGRNKQTQVKPKAMAYVITFDSTKEKDPCRSESSVGSLTLRDHLEKRRPEFAEHINQRRDVLKKLHNLRQVRDENIREIIENTSVTSIPKKLKNLPPPPTKHIRIFATKEMKAMTRKKYSQLPEVVERVEQMKLEKRKKSNKIMADVFNKKIQQRVHKGKISLEHSMTVI